MDLVTLFGKNALDSAIAQIKNQAYYNKKTLKVRYYSDYISGIEQHFDKNNFFINNSKVTFIYPACSIAPCSEGTLTFEVNKNAFNNG